MLIINFCNYITESISRQLDIRCAEGYLEEYDEFDVEVVREIAPFLEWAIPTCNNIEEDLDYFIVDLAAGLSDSVMSFLSACQHRLIVLKNEPSSIADAYATIKVMIQDHSLQNIHLLPNAVLTHSEGEHLCKSVNSVIKNFLGSQVDHLHPISADEMVLRSLKSSQPLITFAPTSKATRDFSILADQIEELEHDTTLTGGLQFQDN